MKLSHKQALNILGIDRAEGLEVGACIDLIKTMYRQACSNVNLHESFPLYGIYHWIPC